MASFVGEIKHRNVYKVAAADAAAAWLLLRIVVTADAPERFGRVGER